MTSSGMGRFSSKQIRILALAWVGVVILVGVCVFLGILWALGPKDDRTQAGIAEQTIVPQDDQPTPVVPDVTADTGDSGAAGASQPTIPPRQDTSFGYGIQVRADMNARKTLDQVLELGLGWIKQQIRWEDLEPEAGAANWDAMDKIMARASERNLRVLVSIVTAPDWSRSVTAEGMSGPPDNSQHLVNYITTMLQRYPGAIHAIEVWNEQNLPREWYTAGGLNSAAYVNMLIPVADAIRQTDPGVIVISGALSPTGVDDGVIAIDDFRYMQGMIDAGMLDYVDCVGAHANGINLPPDISAEDAFAGGMPPGTIFPGPYDTTNPLNPHHSWSFYSTLHGYHEMIVAAGRNTPLCVTEFGWASVEGMDGEPRQGFEFAYDNSLEDQANNIVNAFQLMHDWGFVWLAFLFNLDYSPKIGGDPQDDPTLFSITTGDWEPRPAYDAVRDMPKTP